MTLEPTLLDARGERCPLPVIRLGRLVRDLPSGSLVRLLATDPAARSDVAAFCRMRGHDLVDLAVWPEDASVTAYLVRVSATGPAAAPPAPGPAAGGSPPAGAR